MFGLLAFPWWRPDSRRLVHEVLTPFFGLILKQASKKEAPVRASHLFSQFTLYHIPLVASEEMSGHDRSRTVINLPA